MAVWYSAQYIRTGHLLAYILPPSFIDIPSDRQAFFDGLQSYASQAEVSDKLRREGYVIDNGLTSNFGALRGRHFVVNKLIVKKYILAGEEHLLLLEFYNDRLAHLALCESSKADHLIPTVNAKMNWNLDMYSPLNMGNLSVEYRGGDPDCIHWTETRLLDELRLWDDLTR